jgi:hypothetical protein
MVATVFTVQIKLSLGLNWIKPGSRPDALSLN